MNASHKKIIPWNKGLKGVQKAWNKGLTKEDPRVKQYSITQSKGWDNLSYERRHAIIRKLLGKPSKCTKCNIQMTLNKRGYCNIQWSNISGKYKETLTDWQALCVSCHTTYDKTIKNITWMKLKIPLDNTSAFIL